MSTTDETPVNSRASFLLLMDIKLILDILTLVGLGLVGFFGLIAQFDKARKQQENETNVIEDKVIKLMKEQISVLESKVEEQASNLIALNNRLNELIVENKTLRNVLQGRDKSAQEYQKKGIESMELGKEIYKVIQENRTVMLKILELLEREQK